MPQAGDLIAIVTHGHVREPCFRGALRFGGGIIKYGKHACDASSKLCDHGVRK